MSWWICLLALQAAPLAEVPLPEAELAQQRGGLRLPNGLDIAVTVQTQTALNGGVVLQTVYRVDQGAPTLEIYAPPAGTRVPQEQSAPVSTVGAVAQSPTVSFDRVTGIHVTPGAIAPGVSLTMGTANSPGSVQAGLEPVAPGAITDAGVLSGSSVNGVGSVSLTGADLRITHLTGNAFGAAIENAGNNRVIDTQTTISIDLGSFSPDILGSAMLRAQDIALDAVALRTGGEPIMRRSTSWILMGTALAVIVPSAADAQSTRRARPRPTVQNQLNSAMALIRAQEIRLEQQEAELAALKKRLDERSEAVAVTPRVDAPLPAVAAAQGAAPGAGDPGSALQAPATVALERVGQAPADEDRPIEVAVLENQASVVTRRGALTAEFQADYARADRNRAVFRGIELVQAVLVGVFDINESRQNIVSVSGALRYGVTDRFEVGVRVPFVHRSDTSIVAPVAGSTNNDPAATINSSVRGSNIGDIEVTARYQLLNGQRGLPYLIGNLQAVIPTGTDPFGISRDSLGRPSKAATGAGFWGISPSITAILPSDPVVLFGTLGYTFNLGKSVDTRIPPVIINYVDPGDAFAGSAGIGISFNQRTTLNLGYAHARALGTKTRTSLLMPTAAWPGMRESRSRDLQIGRFLFGVTYRVNDRSSLNWSVEVGATEDATDLRTVLRIPTTLLSGL